MGAVAVALALVALVFSITLPFGGNGGGGGKVKLTLLDRAAAAIPDRGPVVHVVWRQPDTYYAPGSAKMTLRYEEWLDRTSGTDHVIVRSGRKVFDFWTISGEGHLEKNTLINSTSRTSLLGGIAGTPIVTLIVEYRKALDDGKIVLIRRGRAYGRPVYWMRFRCPRAVLADPQKGFLCLERFGLDRHSFVPVAEETHAFKQVQQWNSDHTQWFWASTNEQSDAVMTSNGVPMRRHILKVELIPRDRADIRPPASVFKH